MDLEVKIWVNSNQTKCTLPAPSSVTHSSSGHVLTNESALMWYTARDINDDGKELNIVNKCFDLSGDCPRWKKEGITIYDRCSYSIYVDVLCIE